MVHVAAQQWFCCSFIDSLLRFRKYETVAWLCRHEFAYDPQHGCTVAIMVLPNRTLTTLSCSNCSNIRLSRLCAV